MMEQQILRNMFRMLNESLNESPDGEITIENLTPLENKIKHLRTVLKETNARILYLQSVNAENKIVELPEDDLTATLDQLIEEISSQYVVNDKGVNLSLEINALEEILNNQENSELKEKILQLLKTLYLNSDAALKIENEIKELRAILYHMNVKDLQEAHKYRTFLKEQEELRVNKLQQTNPLEARFKQKMELTMQKINFMKKLIIKLLSASNILLTDDDPYILELLKKHRKIINFETVSNMIQDQDKSSD